jgi:hypothetical protein
MLATLWRRSPNSNEVPSFSTFEQPRVAPLKIVAPKGVQQPRRGVRTEDLVAHVPQQHVLWLAMLGISDELCGDGFETVETGDADPFEI